MSDKDGPLQDLHHSLKAMDERIARNERRAKILLVLVGVALTLLGYVAFISHDLAQIVP